MAFQPTLRLTKGSRLTFQEMDDNFQGLADAVNAGSLPVFDSFADMINANLTNTQSVRTTGYYSATSGDGSGVYVKTTLTGTVGETDGGSYFNDLDGNRWELLTDGTVSLEQFGVQSGVLAGTRISDCVNSSITKKVVTKLNSLRMDRICKITKSNVVVDLGNAEVSWEGDYNPYFTEYGLGDESGGATDRTIGVFSARGQIDISETYTVAGSVSEGQSDLPVDTVVGLSVGDFILLTITYPRRTTTLPAKILEINGTTIGIDYKFGYDADSVTFQKASMLRGVKVSNVKITNNSPTGLVASRKLSGVGFYLCEQPVADNLSLTNGDYPAYITDNCWNPQAKRIKAYFPRDVGPGNGYCVQFNTSQPFYAEDLESYNARHVWDSSHSQYGVVNRAKAYEQRASGITQYTTHGEYEHDIVLRDCYHFNGRVSIALARSGRNFGSFTKRVRIEGGSYSGLMQLSYCPDLHMQDVNLTLVDPTLHELSSAGRSTYHRIKFANPIRIEKDQDTESGVANVYEQIAAEFIDCDFGGNYIRSSFQEGSIILDKCKNLTYMDRSPADPEFDPAEPKLVIIKNMPVTLSSSWQIRATELIKFEDAEITLASTPTLGTGCNKLVIEGGSVNQDPSLNLRITSRAKHNYLTEAVNFKNGAGFRPENADVETFTMEGVLATEPSTTVNSTQFTLNTTTNVKCYVRGCHIKFTSVDPNAYSLGLVFTGNTGTEWNISDSYVEGRMNFNASSTQAKICRFTNVTAPTDVVHGTWRYQDSAAASTTLGALNNQSSIAFSVNNALTAVAGLPIGFITQVSRSAANTVTFTPPVGETLRGSGVLNTDNVMTLRKVSATVWQSSQ